MTAGLPWVLPGREGWVRLEVNGDVRRPVALHVGGHGGAIASLSVGELAALRDACSAVLEGLGVSVPPAGRRSCVCGRVDGPDGASGSDRAGGG